MRTDTRTDWRSRLQRFHQRYMMRIALTTMVAALLFVYFSPFIVVNVPAGHAGVIWRRFGGGTDIENELKEGLHLLLPWNKVALYDVRLQLVEETFDAITKDGLAISATVAFRFRVTEDRVGLLHKHVGPEYLSVLLVPEIGAHTRTQISKFTAEEFYTTYREQVQRQIRDQISQQLYVGNIYSAEGTVLVQVEDVLIKAISLPQRVAEAIERKVEQYQQQLEYDFRIATEIKEAERKRIEGEGLRTLFDRVGSKQIADYLRWLGINATVQLARSNNAKVVVIGNGPNGLPLILGNLEGGGSGNAGLAIGTPEPQTQPPTHAPAKGAPATAPAKTSSTQVPAPLSANNLVRVPPPREETPPPGFSWSPAAAPKDAPEIAR